MRIDRGAKAIAPLLRGPDHLPSDQVWGHKQQSTMLHNEDCYDEGWLIRVALSEPDEQDNLLDDEEYDQFVLEEAG